MKNKAHAHLVLEMVGQNNMPGQNHRNYVSLPKTTFPTPTFPQYRYSFTLNATINMVFSSHRERWYLMKDLYFRKLIDRNPVYLIKC